MGLALLNCSPPTTAAQTFGHRPSSKLQPASCLVNAYLMGGTKAGWGEGWVSHLVKTGAALGVMHSIDGSAGQRGDLSTLLRQWVPSAKCSEAGTKTFAFSACQYALNKMPTSKFLEIFGPQGIPYIDVPLPVKYSDC